MQSEKRQLSELIHDCAHGLSLPKKCGRDVLQPKIADALLAAGFDVDCEDTRRFLPAGLPAWRDKESESVVEVKPRNRLKMDLVVRLGDDVVALIEVESDLNDLRESGISRRNGHYDVFSISANASGEWFNSYKSIERMAAAAFYSSGRDRFMLEKLKSNAPQDHNPGGLDLFLVTGISRELDRRILKPRLESLGASLISVNEN